MEVLFLAILGLLQGLCEFLPISSSGHLVLFSSLFGVNDSLLVSIVLHVATLFAVIVVYHKDMKNWILHPFSPFAMKIYIATIPTCLIVLVLMPLISDSFGGKYLGICFLLSAIVLALTDFLSKKKKGKEIGVKNALIMGLAQGIAVFPGISRSGATISAGLLSGGDKKECAKFSFLMSVPIILMSMFMEIIKLIKGQEIVSVSIFGLILGSVLAFVVGILSIKLMIKVTEKLHFKWFAIYLVILSIMCIILL